jgi:hypothetical protein
MLMTTLRSSTKSQLLKCKPLRQHARISARRRDPTGTSLKTRGMVLQPCRPQSSLGQDGCVYCCLIIGSDSLLLLVSSPCATRSHPNSATIIVSGCLF